MGKMKELSTVLDEIVTCGETLVQGAEKTDAPGEAKK